jgi:hypothetical protein
MRLPARRIASIAAAAALMSCLMQGTAHAAAFSATVTPFPSSGMYVPIVDEQVDPSNPLFLYDALFISAFPIDAATTQYDFFGTLSFPPDPAFAIAGGSMLTVEDAPGQFTTCWSYGCSPDPDNIFLFFEALEGGVTPLFRADPDSDRASTGAMTASPLAGGGFAIASFFDIFIEIFNSDTGEYEDLEGSIRYVLVGEPISEIPEPGTMLLLGSGLLLLARRYRSRTARAATEGAARQTDSPAPIRLAGSPIRS